MTGNLTVIVPTRGRPAAVHELADAFADTCELATILTIAVDHDDPELDAYAEAVASASHLHRQLVVTPGGTMVKALNHAAARVDTAAVGFMGDDHRPRSKGWDAAYVEALRELGTGIVYGNDLVQGERLATQCAMTTNIVRTLGFMGLPDLVHLYLDNFWMGLGLGIGALRYLPDVVVEHLHPVAGTAEWDEGYRRVNAREMYEQDERAFRDYLTGPRSSAYIEKLAALR